MSPVLGGGLRYNADGNAAGAQTERRGGAGPAGGLLGGKDPAGRFVFLLVLRGRPVPAVIAGTIRGLALFIRPSRSVLPQLRTPSLTRGDRKGRRGWPGRGS